MPSPYIVRMADSILKTAVSEILSLVSGKLIDLIFRKKEESKSEDSSMQKNTVPDRIHPWRPCPFGESWVVTHPLRVPKSKRGPEHTVTRRGHCRTNPGKKEVFHPEEFLKIASMHFPKLVQMPELLPTSQNMNFTKRKGGFEDGNSYDLIIAGWTKFWNDIFNPKILLDPNLVKVLIMSESSFRPLLSTVSKKGYANGLIQITDETRKILNNRKGELKDFYIDIESEDLFIPEINLAVGIRWLFQKHRLAKKRLKREPTWEEVIAEYKGISKQVGKGPKSNKIMKKIREDYETLKSLKK